MAPTHSATFATLAVAFAFAFALVLPMADANAFLRGQTRFASEGGDDLLQELESALGDFHRAGAEARLTEIESAMLPTFRTLPKAQGALLSSAGARYLLHRYFVTKHNWYVRGFDNGGDAWEVASPSMAFEAHSNGQIVGGIFESRLGSRGLSLRETALLAATLESLVHEENIARLSVAYTVMGVERNSLAVTEREVEAVMDAYMIMYLKRSNSSEVVPEDITSALEQGEDWFAYWPATQGWLRQVREEVVSVEPDRRSSFEATSQVTDEVAHRYGRYAHQECLDIKHDIMQYEKGTTGRVPLSEFYSAALNGSWQFSESKEYLRHIGALDESDPVRPSVIIPNYVLSPSNCMAGTHFYSVCCINECGPILADIERIVAAPDALPRQIVEIIEMLPSATVTSPRALPNAMIRRLDAVAAEHGGRVPLHSRLFAQWLHNAYPRECPFPHLAGTTVPMEGALWESSTGKELIASAEDMHEHIFQAHSPESFSTTSQQGQQLMPQGGGEEEEEGLACSWHHEEELFIRTVVPPEPTPRASRGASVMRSLVFAAVSCSAMLGLLRAAQGAAQSTCGSNKGRKTVLLM